jgi:hypothetical protein
MGLTSVSQSSFVEAVEAVGWGEEYAVEVVAVLTGFRLEE